MNPTRRNTQEDVHVVHGPGTWGAPNANATFLGVMDGHGGRLIADYLEEHLATNIAKEWTFAQSEHLNNDKTISSGTNNNSNEGVGGESEGSKVWNLELKKKPMTKKRRIVGDDQNESERNKENNDDNASTSSSNCSNCHSTKAAAAAVGAEAAAEKESKSIQIALERAFLVTDIQSRLDGITTSGATVACCIVIPNFSPQSGILTSVTIHSANAGDARAVLSSGTARRQRQPTHGSSCSTNDNNSKPESCNDYRKSKLPNPELDNELPLHLGTNALRLSHDHKSTDPVEINRIQSSGGIILRGRVLGVLAIARSLGDHGLKEFVIAKPYLSSTTLRFMERHHLHPSDGNNSELMSLSSSSHQAPYTDGEFLIVACDGLWDVMEDQEVVDFVRRHVHDDGGKHRREDVASFVIKEALKRGSTDNITVIIYWL